MEDKEYWEKRKKYNYYNLDFDLYKVEVGVLLDKDNEEYGCYNGVYDKLNSYYDENVVFELDYLKALEYAKNYVENGVNGTYAIISKIYYNSEEIYGGDTDEEIDIVSRDLNDILGGSHIDNDYIDMFGSQQLYGLNNVIYSIWKQKNEENPYFLGKGNGKIVENFIGEEVL